MSSNARSQQYLELARTLITCVEADDEPGMQQAVDELTRLRETELFQEIGQLTRELHEALKSFRLDGRLTDMAANEIPDARERLKHVIEVTSRAAHRTLEAVETSLPLADEVGSRAGALHEEWQRFRRRELTADEFRCLSHDVEGFLAVAASNGRALHDALSETLMAQDYQDITGQIIRRVITLVQEVEDGLVALVRLSGARMAEEKPPAADNANERDKQQLSGPAVPGQSGDEVVSGQDDVDELLSSLGF